MGGKTVALKMAGLFVVMTYCGMQLPAGGATCIGRFERVVADIGDEQSLAANASTFSAHLQRMREILDDADARTLAIVDEIGGGTEPSAGAALAVAMLERLLGVRCARDRLDALDRAQTFRARHARASRTRACVSIPEPSRRPSSSMSARRASRWPFRSRRRSGRFATRSSTRATALLEERERDYEAALAELSLRNSELREARLRLNERTPRRRRAQRGPARHDRGERRRATAPFRRERARNGLQQSLRDFARELQRRADELGASVRAARAGHARRKPALLAQTIEAMRRDLGIRPDAPPSPAPARAMQPAIAFASFR